MFAHDGFCACALAADQRVEHRVVLHVGEVEAPVFDALVSRQGARAEAIMREHANATLRYAEVFGAINNGDRMKVIARGE